jgi:hypothetical protein
MSRVASPERGGPSFKTSHLDTVARVWPVSALSVFEPVKADSGVTWTDVVAAVATGAAAIVVLVTAFFALRQLSEAKKTRYAALAADLTRRWDEPLMASSRRRMSSRTHDEIREIVEANYTGTASDEQKNDYYTLQALPNFIEGIAAIEDEFGGLSLEFVNRLWGGVIIRAWDRWAAAAHWVRTQPNAEAAYRNFEDLANSLTELRERQARA